MQDEMIVDLYWSRDQRAIWETEQKYGNYLMKIAYNILANMSDCEECVNDTYFKAWNAMPPHRPDVLSTFLGKITRRTAIDRYRKQNADKRKAFEYSISLSELEECVVGNNSPEKEIDAMALGKAINSFLHGLPVETRTIFVGRYFFVDSIRDLTKYYGMSESKVKSMLHRTRLGLKSYLEKEGFYL